MRQILPYQLWLGHIGDARDKRLIHKTGIVAVVDLAQNEAPEVFSRECTYCRWPLHDGMGNHEWMLRGAIGTVAHLLLSRIPTLVYCAAGMSRSVAVAAGAISVVTSRPFQDVILEVAKSGASDISPGLWLDVAALVPTIANVANSVHNLSR